jgi:hypothetical protein
MTESRIYRPGIDFPPAITIRSAPYHPPTPSAYDLPSTSTLDPLPSEAVTWHEWNINPANHGPAHLTRMPVFVPASTQYDELGRSSRDGVDVVVEDGRKDSRDIEDGQAVAEWYRSLAGDAPRMLGTGSPKSAPLRVLANTMQDPIDLTRSPSPPVTIPSEADDIKRTMTDMPIPTIRVDKSDWYIRRALLRHPQPLNRPESVPPISALLNIPPQVRVQPARFALGPDNVGYAMLDRLGWEGGGLGRPPDWDPTNLPSRDIPQDQREIILDINGNTVIDLVDDSDESDQEFSLEPLRQGGPGRLTPISTALKLDRSGLGRRIMEKQVTHSLAEIERAQRRAKLGKPNGKGDGEMGKKGKLRMKEKEKREREERRKIQAALNG